MTPTPAAQRWQAVSALLDLALDLPAAQRAAWRAALSLPDATGPAPEVLVELDRLLAAHDQAAHTDALAALPMLGPRPDAERAAGLQPGQHIGPWALVAPLGEGGMAVVWRARRADGAYTREVALKLARRLPWRADLAERLVRERDILARLTHPHIARFYDAGISDEAAAGEHQGLPWLAMELVDGLPLTDWCDARQLSPRARVRLFLQVLDAVAHAHSVLVLHRDLKPSNIMVNTDGEVRLLDFGIAKLLDVDAGLTSDTGLTQFGGRALTPDYASPEQLRGEPLSTASDVYSLGVVLYELLCGEHPHRLRHRSAAQLETAVLEADPTRPSARPAAPRAEARGMTPHRLSRELRGELDAIVLMALRKSPSDRYAGAAEFRADLQRWLNGLPVLARPNSLGYRTAAFVRRHRVGVALTAGVVALLLVTTAVSVRQSERAQREASRARATRDFLLGLYKPMSWLNANPSRGGQVSARELLDLSAAQLRAQPLSDPEVQRDVLRLLVQLYADVGDVKSRELTAQDLSRHAAAAFGQTSPEHVEALVLLAEAQTATDQAAAAATLNRIATLAPRGAVLPPSVRARELVVRGEVGEARDALQAASAFMAALALLPPEQGEVMLRVRAMLGIARAHTSARNELNQARTTYEQVLAMLRADPSVPAFAQTEPEAGLADVESRLGHFSRALALYTQAHERCAKLLGPGHVDSLQTGYRLGLTLNLTGRPQAALALLTGLRGNASLAQGAGDAYSLPSIDVEIGNARALLGQVDEANTAYLAALDGLGRLGGAGPNVWRAFWRGRQVAILATAGRRAEAAEALRQVRSEAAQIGPASHVERQLARSQALLAVFEAAHSRQPDDALASIGRWALLERQLSAEASPTLVARNQATAALWRAQALMFGGRAAQASTEAATALQALTPEVVAEIGVLEQGTAWSLSAEAAWAAGAREQACAAATRAEALLGNQVPATPQRLIARRLVALCGQAQPAAVLAPAEAPAEVPAPATVWRSRWQRLDAPAASRR